MKLFRWLRPRAPEKKRRIHVQDDTAFALLRLLSVCPVCSGDLAEHRYALLGHAVHEPGEGADSPALFQLLREKRWEEARGHRSFDQAKDAFEAYALRCKEGRLAVLYIQNPVEWMSLPRLLAWDPVDAESAPALLGHIREIEWKQLDRRQRARTRHRGR